MASEGEYSDLTELETDEDYDIPTKKGKKASHAGWRIRNALKVPRATTYTAQALYDQIYGCDINLEPEYQRDVVWSEVKQIGIIDSVFRNFYIPPVIFAVNVQEDGSETKTCIDGKQRLTSIHKFMEGLIPHKDPITGEKLWYKDIQGGGTRRKLLPEKYRRLFANKQIVCVEYQDITDADEREIFQRVQLGMALTPAEKLQVVKTPRSDFIRSLQNTFAKEDGWLGPKHLAWDVTRGSDYRGIAYAVYCMVTFPTLNSGLVTMAQLEKWLGIDEPLPPAKRESVEEAFRLFSEIVQDKKLSKDLHTPTKISPVEFIFVAVLIYVHKDKASLPVLAAGIAEMRLHVRKLHVDVRMNSRVSKSMVDFIKKWVPKKGSGSASEAASASSKRKRAAKKAAEQAEEDQASADEDMDVDDGPDNDVTFEPKAKKKNTGRLTNADASTSKATPPLQVKSENAASPSISAAPPPAPPTDRMSAMKLAKAKVAQAQAERARQIPTAPRALRLESTFNAQMLPSPTQAHTLPANLAAALNRAPPPSSASGRSQSGDHTPRLGHLPPPPTSGTSDGSFRNGERGRTNSGVFDAERDPQRRESSGYQRPRSPGTSTRWRT